MARGAVYTATHRALKKSPRHRRELARSRDSACSWNAAASLGVFSGIWQPGAAIVLLTVLLAVGRRLWRRERHPIGRDAEKAAVAGWAPAHALAASARTRA